MTKKWSTFLLMALLLMSFLLIGLLFVGNIAVAKSGDPQYINIKIGSHLANGETATISSENGLGVYDNAGNLIQTLENNEVIVKNEDGTISYSGLTWNGNVSVQESVEVTTIESKPKKTRPRAIIEILMDLPEIVIEEEEEVVTTTVEGKVLVQDQLLQPLNGGMININGKPYRGAVYFVVNDGMVTVVNHVLIDDYLKGVVPREIGASSPFEAQKAQAIASRSFAVSNMNKFIDKGYNLCDTQSSQVYGGVESESEQTNSAVDVTAGIYGRYNGEIASMIYGSTTGGLSESAKNVWGGDQLPYLESIEDPYSLNAPYANWEVKMTLDELSQHFAGTEYDVGKITAINIKETTPAHRVQKMDLIGENGTKELTGHRFRMTIGSMEVMSTWFDVSVDGEEVVINGHGFGHGVGMSQNGAIEMANQGLNCRDILSHYYPKLVIDQ